MSKRIVFLTAVVLAMALMLAGQAFAGSLDAPGAPSAGSGMPTLTDIYNQLDTGATSTPASSFQEPSSGPTAGTGKSLSDIKLKLPVPDNTNGATVADVFSGKTFWGLRTDGTWGLKTGSISSGSNVSGGDGQKTFAIPDGYYSGKTATANDANLSSGNIKGGVSIFGVSGSAIESSGNATAGDVLSGKTFSNAGGAGIGGSMPNNGAANFTPGAAAVPVSAGYYSGGQVNGDANLAGGNIKSGVSIFGVSGNPNVVDTSSGNAGATDIKRGKKAWVSGIEVTGTLSGGYTCTTGNLSPLGRWCDNNNGSVRDMTTGLIWLNNAGWGGRYPLYVDTQNGTNAHDRAAQTKAGNPATLTDGSVEGDWRLPTKSELAAIATGTEYIRNIAMYKFINVQTNIYWSSTTNAADTLYGWYVDMTNGYVGSNNGKNGGGYVWPVRSGQ